MENIFLIMYNKKGVIVTDLINLKRNTFCMILLLFLISYTYNMYFIAKLFFKNIYKFSLNFKIII